MTLAVRAAFVHRSLMVRALLGGMLALVAGWSPAQEPAGDAQRSSAGHVSRTVTTPPLSATGYQEAGSGAVAEASFPRRTVTTPPLSAAGYGAEAAPSSARKFSLIRVVPLDDGTNPFDFEDVRRDVLAARTPGGGGDGGAAGALTPLIYTGFTLFGEGAPAYIKIDVHGPNTLSAFLDGPDANTALVFTVNGADNTTGNLNAGPAWQIISRSHANPVSEQVFPSFVVRQLAGGNYYKITVLFTNTGGGTYSIDLLSGFNCGAAAASCPP